jgi:hypothetical protein
MMHLRFGLSSEHRRASLCGRPCRRFVLDVAGDGREAVALAMVAELNGLRLQNPGTVDHPYGISRPSSGISSRSLWDW